MLCCTIPLCPNPMFYNHLIVLVSSQYHTGHVSPNKTGLEVMLWPGSGKVRFIVFDPSRPHICCIQTPLHPPPPTPHFMTNDAQPERPSQGLFSSDQTKFLKTFLPDYMVKVEEIAKIGSGPKGIAGTKGDKKAWIEEVVYPAYCTKFEVDKPEGPNLATLKMVSTRPGYPTLPLTSFPLQKIVRWFTNRSKPGTGIPTTATLPPKPRATNASALFAAANKTEISDAMAAKRRERGLAPKDANFDLFREVSAQMFHATDADTRSHYEAMAQDFNAKLQEPPSTDEIYAYVALPH